MAERYGLFVMLMVGESVIAIVTDSKEIEPENGLIIFFGFGILFALQQQYFGAQPEEREEHALHQSAFAGRIFIHGHLFLGMSLIGLGSGFGLVKKNGDQHYSSDP
ncbi:hypothetical protein AAMO2058_000373800 [Amorphochlora amoebiformis]